MDEGQQRKSSSILVNDWRLKKVVLLTLLVGCNGQHVRTDRPPLEQVWNPEPGIPLTVQITGNDFDWHIRYPGGDGTIGTPDDIPALRHLHLPIDTNVVLQLESKDYLYSLALPHWNLREIAVPDLTFTMEFHTDTLGTYELKGDQMCGFAHSNLMGTLVVQTASDFETWLRERGRREDSVQ